MTGDQRQKADRGKKVPNISIAWQLSLYIIGITTFLAVIILAFNYYIHYKAEVRRVSQSRNEIEESQVPQLASALWDYDFHRVRTQLRGMLAIRHIGFVEVTSDYHKFSYGSQQKKSDFAYDFVLAHPQAGPIGTLSVQYASGSIKKAVVNELLIIAVAVLAQMLLTAIMIIWMFRYKVTRHLIALGHYAKELSTENLGKGFRFNRKSNAPHVDELDYLLDSMDQMRKNMILQLEFRNKMVEQLQKAQKMEAIGTLAGGIAHDFNNILGAIIGFSELTTMYLEEGSNAKENIQQVLKAGNRAKDLVNQILTFSRQTDQQRRPTYIGHIIKEALKLLRASLPSTIEIKQNIASEQEAVVVDPTQIYQVLMNLCTNSAHAMGENGGTLTVSLGHESIENEMLPENAGLSAGRYLLLTVQDSGHGIKPDIINKIFDPYYTTKAPGEGTGLGLAVAQGIVAAHGGSIRVETQLGEGTTFYVYLPVGTTQHVSEERHESDLKKGKERILFIDDEAPIAELGMALLENLGYQAVAYTDAAEALEHFRHHATEYDAIITDMTMPKLSGDLLAKELNAIRSDIPIILCTGLGFQKNQATHLEEFGVRQFLKKPFSLADLSDIVRSALEKE